MGIESSSSVIESSPGNLVGTTRLLHYFYSRQEINRLYTIDAFSRHERLLPLTAIDAFSRQKNGPRLDACN